MAGRPPCGRAVPRRWSGLWLVLLVVAAGWGYLQPSSRVEKALLDHLLASAQQRPAPTDVVIVAIDDRSLARLGRWPWPRSRHAELLDRLRSAGAKAVGLDLILAEPDHEQPQNDQRLAEAMRRHGRVVLPLHAHSLQAQTLEPALPAAPLLAAARATGHAHMELDSDGVARGVFLQEGADGRWWDHWSLALLKAGGDRPRLRTVPEGRADPGDVSAQAGSGAWLRSHPVLIPFSGPPGHFTRLSYADVLAGTVPADALRDKYVFIGMTAAGLGDAYLTPAASEDSLMPGVEVSAHIFDALRSGVELRPALGWENSLFCAIPVALALLAMCRLAPRSALAAVAGLLVVVYGAAWVAMRHGVVFAPLAALGTLVAAYPLWSRWRLESALRYLSEEFRRIQLDEPLLGAVRPSGASGGDLLGQRMADLSAGVNQLRGLLQFVHDSLDSLPDPVLVLDVGGRVLLVNGAAVRYFREESAGLLRQPVEGLLARRGLTEDGRPFLSWQAALASATEVHARDDEGREWLLKVAHRGGSPASGGCLLSLTDVSSVHQVQRQREEALRFISHDMRAPQSAILTLVELHRLSEGRLPPIFDRISSHARRTLALADDFVHLARAQSDAYRIEAVNLADVLLDAADRLWDHARARKVRIATEVGDQEAGVLADRELLTRAVANLIDNAIKYGPEGGTVSCCLARDGAGWVLAIADEGPGIARDLQAGLFQQFKRLGPDTRTSGAGLGLAFVQAVMLRHRGSVSLKSQAQAQAGAEFHLWLPAEP